MQWSDRIGRRVKLRDLHILLAVAQTGSMVRAADSLANRWSRRRKKGSGRRADQDVCDAVMRLREIGVVPWDWIVDETRSVDG
jgi:hypothetical protein